MFSTIATLQIILDFTTAGGYNDTTNFGAASFQASYGAGPTVFNYAPYTYPWQALLDKGSDAYRVYVPDGVHPSASGLALYMTPVLLHALGVPAPKS